MFKRLQNKIKYKSILWLLFYLFIFAFLLHHSYSYLDPDLGWHLKTGEEIIATGAVPHINQIDYTLLGQRWVDHEWFSNVLVDWLYTRLGYWSLNVLFALLITGVFLIINRFIRREISRSDEDFWLLVPLEIVSLIAMASSLGVRVQEFSILGLVLLLSIIYYYNKNKNWRRLFWLLPLFYLWACMHAGFLLGLGLLVIFTGVKIFELILPAKFKNARLETAEFLTGRQIAIFAGFSLAALAVTFATPYGFELYSFLGTYTSTFYMTHILEWLPQWSLPYLYWQVFYICLIIIALGFYVVFAFRKKGGLRISAWQFSLALVLMAMATQSRRHTPLLIAATLPFLAKFLIDFLNIKFSDQAEKKPLKKSWVNAFVGIYLILIFSLPLAEEFLSTSFVSDPFRGFCEDRFAADHSLQTPYPCAAVEFLKSHPEYDSRRLLNEFGWGGFLIWAYPERQLFIDGRLPQADYEGQTLLEEYWNFLQPDTIPKYLKKHDIRLVLLKTIESKPHFSWFERNFLWLDANELDFTNYLEEYLKSDPQWKIIYQDSISAIYVHQ